MTKHFFIVKYKKYFIRLGAGTGIRFHYPATQCCSLLVENIRNGSSLLLFIELFNIKNGHQKVFCFYEKAD